MTIIPYTRDLNIQNVGMLPRGTGARYLEVIAGPGTTLIAKCWRRVPVKGSIVVEFTSQRPTEEGPP